MDRKTTALQRANLPSIPCPKQAVLQVPRQGNAGGAEEPVGPPLAAPTLLQQSHELAPCFLAAIFTGLRKELRGDKALRAAGEARGDTELLLPSSEAAQGHASPSSAWYLQGPAEHRAHTLTQSSCYSSLFQRETMCYTKGPPTQPAVNPQLRPRSQEHMEPHSSSAEGPANHEFCTW